LTNWKGSLAKKALSRMYAIILAAIIIIAAVGGGLAYYFYSRGPAVEQTIPGKRNPSNDIVIGLTMGLTGWAAKGGRETLRGYEMWVRDINSRGGLLNRTVRLVTYDDQCDGETARTYVEKLITVDQVDLLLGSYGEATIFTGAATAKKYDMIYLNAGASARSAYQEGNQYLFCTYSSTIDVIVQNTWDLLGSLGVKTAAIANNDDTAYGENCRAGMQTGAQRNNITIVSDELYAAYQITDAKSIVSKEIQANPDALYVGTFYDDAILFVRAMKELNWYPKIFVATIGPSEPEFKDVLGADGEYICYPTMFESSFTWDGAQAFNAEHVLYYGNNASYHTACGYATCQILEKTVTATQTLEGPAHSAYLLNTTTPNILTVIGNFKFDSTGINTIAGCATAQWLNGTRHIVWPAEFATTQVRYPAPAWNQR
jgi:branched-chain amino acid transport system substrate-binding protein